jgi:gas vesicle protein GvpL/GvpF
MSRIYIYAIVPAAERLPLDVAGVWPPEPQVRTIRGDALAAVVGTAPPIDFRALSRDDAVRYLLAHQRVVESVMRNSAALPVKFGTTLPDQTAVVSMLVRGATVLAPPLAELSQHVQIELIVSWSIDDILHEVAIEDAVVQLKTRFTAQAGGATAHQRLAIGKLVKESIDRRRDHYRSRIITTVRSVAADLVENALMDDRMVANLALLLAQDSSDALDHRLAELDGEFGNRLNFRCIGPLPPYSFATVEVSLPSFEAIDQARRVLSLGERAGLAEIKSAYRRQIRQVHPDLPTAAARLEEGRATTLTDAYKTLVNYAEALPPAAVDDTPDDAGCRFDRGTVEGSIMVMVRRQELATRAETHT